MNLLTIKKANEFDISINNIASDKSISHRCAIFSLLSDKPSYITNYLQAEDTLNTLKIIQNLGAKVDVKNDIITIIPPKSIIEPITSLNCGNSGTAMRLMCGFLAQQDGFFVLEGDKYLSNRPMKRVTEPLKKIGAMIDGREDGNLAPIAIRGNTLKGFNYTSSIASAQVKSAMILSVLYAKEKSYYFEPFLS